MRSLAFAVGIAVVASLALGPALGQTSALKGHDTGAPVDVAADRLEVQDRADRAIFSGNVVVRQAGLTLSAPRVTVVYSDTGGIDIRRIDASGGVLVRSPSETARGQFALYDVNRRLITLIGAVELTQERNRVEGGRLVIDLDTGRAVMDGGASGTGGRVTGTFTVPRRGD